MYWTVCKGSLLLLHLLGNNDLCYNVRYPALCSSLIFKTEAFWHWSILQQLSVPLTHWGRVTHICVGNLTIIGPDNGLSPGRRQAIIWTNAGILLIGPGGTNFSEILIGIHTFSFKKINLKMSSGKWRPSCLGLNVLMAETGTCPPLLWIHVWWALFSTLTAIWDFQAYQSYCKMLSDQEKRIQTWINSQKTLDKSHD